MSDRVYDNDPALVKASINAASMLIAIYEMHTKVKLAGGCTCLSGVAAARTMMIAMERNKDRFNALVLQPLADAVEFAGPLTTVAQLIAADRVAKTGSSG